MTTDTDLVTAPLPSPAATAPALPSQREAARRRFPARPCPAVWPGNERPRHEAEGLLARPPFLPEYGHEH